MQLVLRWVVMTLRSCSWHNVVTSTGQDCSVVTSTRSHAPHLSSVCTAAVESGREADGKRATGGVGEEGRVRREEGERGESVGERRSMEGSGVLKQVCVSVGAGCCGGG